MIYKHIGQRLKKRPKKYIPPFKLPGCRPNVPLTKALALRNKIAADPVLKEKVLIDFSIFCSFDGNDLLTSFANDKDGDSSVLDFIVHCLHYDDIVHKEDSVGYRVFLTTGFFASPPPNPLIIQHFFTYCFNLFFYLTGLFFSLCPL